jgi:hypothetical protein
MSGSGTNPFEYHEDLDFQEINQDMDMLNEEHDLPFEIADASEDWHEHLNYMIPKRCLNDEELNLKTKLALSFNNYETTQTNEPVQKKYLDYGDMLFADVIKNASLERFKEMVECGKVTFNDDEVVVKDILVSYVNPIGMTSNEKTELCDKMKYLEEAYPEARIMTSLQRKQIMTSTTSNADWFDGLGCKLARRIGLDVTGSIKESDPLPPSHNDVMAVREVDAMAEVDAILEADGIQKDCTYQTYSVHCVNWDLLEVLRNRLELQTSSMKPDKKKEAFDEQERKEQKLDTRERAALHALTHEGKSKNIKIAVTNWTKNLKAFFQTMDSGVQRPWFRIHMMEGLLPGQVSKGQHYSFYMKLYMWLKVCSRRSQARKTVYLTRFLSHHKQKVHGERMHTTFVIGHSAQITKKLLDPEQSRGPQARVLQLLASQPLFSAIEVNVNKVSNQQVQHDYDPQDALEGIVDFATQARGHTESVAIKGGFDGYDIFPLLGKDTSAVRDDQEKFLQAVRTQALSNA